MDHHLHLLPISHGPWTITSLTVEREMKMKGRRPQPLDSRRSRKNFFFNFAVSTTALVDLMKEFFDWLKILWWIFINVYTEHSLDSET
jgi:hypothetical protein